MNVHPVFYPLALPLCVSLVLHLSLIGVEIHHAAKNLSQLSESMMKVSKSGLSSDTSASTKSSTVGRLCSIPIAQEHNRLLGHVFGVHICLCEEIALAGHWDELVLYFP